MSGCGRILGGGVAPCTNDQSNHKYCVGWSGKDGGFIEETNPEYEPPKAIKDPKRTQSALEGIKGRVAGDPTTSGFAAALEASEGSAGASWNDLQKAQVRTAIRLVCERHAGGGEFTTDEVWAELAGRVPVSKGMTSMLTKATRDGWMDNTGKTTIANRGGEHDHGQRLTVWYSLMERKL